MALDITCPSCGRTALISSAYADRDVICANCHTRYPATPRPEGGAPPAAAGVVVTCPSCDRSYAVSEFHLGRPITCLWCQHRYRVTPAGGGAPDADGEDERIAIACPSCGYQGTATEAYVGHAVGCPQCKALFVVRPEPDSVEMPTPTVWPIVMALGVTLLAAGVATNPALSAVGAVLFVIGLGGWVGQLMPGQGHAHEPFADPADRARPVAAKPGTVDQLGPGMAGYRLRIPEKMHPYSTGIKGGFFGGLVMPIPALAYGVQSGHGPWFPINLLAGMVLPGIDAMTVQELEQFSMTATIVAVAIHAVISLGIGLLYGVLLPTLPSFPGSPLLFGGLIMPLLWTAASYAFMGVINPALRQHVDWPWFILSQVVYGVVASIVISLSQKVPVPEGGTGVAV
jgi:hypothetical protein